MPVHRKQRNAGLCARSHEKFVVEKRRLRSVFDAMKQAEQEHASTVDSDRSADAVDPRGFA
jgi:hypothetical protein